MVTKKKTWGENGFTTKIYFGAYEYTLKFVPEEEIRKFVHAEDDGQSVFGGINCFEQSILICCDNTPQTQKVTLLHELAHAILLRNGNSKDLDDKTPESEELVDTFALGVFELIRRNPEFTRWITS